MQKQISLFRTRLRSLSPSGLTRGPTPPMGARTSSTEGDKKREYTKLCRQTLSLLFSLLLSSPAWAHQSSILPGETLGLVWSIPFVGMLLSLALLPLISKSFWEAHHGKVAYFWSAMTLGGLWYAFGWDLTHKALGGMMLHHYIPFIIMMGALYTIAGGIHINVRAPSTPLINTGFLAFGTFLAGWIGTTGASMLLIRPFLRLNTGRPRRAYQLVFFIFLISNVGGALTPLGDPPLFLGFLNGVSFAWTLKNLALPMLMVAVPLLLIFYVIDRLRPGARPDSFEEMPLVSLAGKTNIFLFLILMALVLLSGCWKPACHFQVFGTLLEFQNVVRDGGLLLLALFSYTATVPEIRKKNHYSWEPLSEVAKLFLGIFVTLLPVSAMLDAGTHGPLSTLVSLVTVNGQPENGMYFWLSGFLSSFLDNAPTYLVFFHMAGGDAEILMTSLSKTLMAISLGSVFMGAMTYIGNAPNFMVKSVAESYGLKMPSFFGYILWSAGILLPVLLIVSWCHF